MPFNEILKNYENKPKLVKMLKAEEASNSINLQDDKATIMFGTRVENS